MKNNSPKFVFLIMKYSFLWFLPLSRGLEWDEVIRTVIFSLLILERDSKTEREKQRFIVPLIYVFIG